MNNDKRILAFLSLGLLLTTVLGPFFIAAYGRADLAIRFAGVAALLTMLCGVLSWSERIGRIVTVACLAVTITGGFVLFGMYRFRDGFNVYVPPRQPEVATRTDTPSK